MDRRRPSGQIARFRPPPSRLASEVLPEKLSPTGGKLFVEKLGKPFCYVPRGGVFLSVTEKLFFQARGVEVALRFGGRISLVYLGGCARGV